MQNIFSFFPVPIGIQGNSFLSAHLYEIGYKSSLESPKNLRYKSQDSTRRSFVYAMSGVIVTRNGRVLYINY